MHEIKTAFCFSRLKKCLCCQSSKKCSVNCANKIFNLSMFLFSCFTNNNNIFPTQPSYNSNDLRITVKSCYTHNDNEYLKYIILNMNRCRHSCLVMKFYSQLYYWTILIGYWYNCVFKHGTTIRDIITGQTLQ